MDYIVFLFAKAVGAITGLFGGGTNLPGALALKLRPHILKRLIRGYTTVLITGTNGKTTTAATLQTILKTAGKHAINSTSGANMKSGVASCLIKNRPIFRKVHNDYAILEVDEAYMRLVVSDLSPTVIAVTNIFRDQLDRYGEVDKTLSLIEDACQKAPQATLVLNGDEAMLGGFLPQNKHYYYGFRVPIHTGEVPVINAEGKFCKKCSTPYTYDFVTFNHLGSYRCPACGFAHPKLDLGVDEILNISADNSNIKANNMELFVPQAGTYNIYNALCAASCAHVLGLPDDIITRGISEQKSKFGRQETVEIDRAQVRIILIKNPAGANEAIRSAIPDKSPVTLGVLLNDKFADGTDVSWIYDVDFEQLSQMEYKQLIIGGTRAYDMAVRMQVGGFDKNRFKVCENYDALLDALRACEGRIYLFTTYTAMISFRKYLYGKKYIKKLWF